MKELFGLDAPLASNFKDIAYNVKQNNWDWLHFNSGIERGGKSGFSLSQAKYVSSLGMEFDWSKDLKNIFFLEPNLAEKMLDLEPKSVVILDEGAESLLSRQAMSSAVIDVIQTLMVYGAKNIFLIINMPDWRWIDKYVRESRIRSLCDVRTYPRTVNDNGEARIVRERGFYSFFSRRKVLRYGQFDPPRLGKPSFNGVFDNFAELYPEEWAWYSEKKTKFLMDKTAKAARERRVREHKGLIAEAATEKKMNKIYRDEDKDRLKLAKLRLKEAGLN